MMVSQRNRREGEMAKLSDELLGWVSEVAGHAIRDAVSVHIGAQRDSGSFRLRMAGGDFNDLVLKVPVPERIGPRMVATNARALQLAAEFGLSAPRLVGADLRDHPAWADCPQDARQPDRGSRAGAAGATTIYALNATLGLGL